ncbi:MAG TPA: hypothetical protein DCR14_07145 [Acidimicrobiaceae bacterium]|nr:hypothetical protein [Acidimicrobiaceae bacterium]
MMKATALEALRRFWWVALLFAVGGAVLGALPEPATTTDAQVSYTATHTLLVESDSGSIFSDPIAVNQIQLRATSGDVPKRVAAELGLPEGSSAPAIGAALEPTTGSLSLTANAATAGEAEQLADTYATVLISYMAELQENERTDRLTALQTRAERLEADIDELQRQVADDPDNRVLQAQLDALSREYSVVFEQQYGNEFTQSGVLRLSTLSSAQAVAVSTEAGGLSAPKSRLGRGVSGLAVGALLGAGVALVMSRLDRRVRSRAQAELLFGGQASVVIPDVGDAGSSIAVRPDRHDQLSDAYRTLRSVLSFAQAARLDLGDTGDGASIVLVVSPGSGDGKTSIAANLASALVETNKRTIAVNTDFRRPTIARRLVGDDLTPLPFSFDQLTEVPPTQLLRRTPTPNLVLLDLSGVEAPPGSLARATTRVLPALAKVADAVVIDSSPVGATAEVLELLPFADHVVVAIRLDHTLTSATQRSMQLLRSLTTGDLHLVVVGENIERSPYYEYGNPAGKRKKPAKR